jgi:hypothetical protein
MRNRLIRQPSFGRHLHVAVVTNGFNERALVRLAWYDHYSVITAFEQRGAGIETQSALLTLWTVAR